MWDSGYIITIVMTTIGGIIWAIRLEGKVSQHDQLFAEREKMTTGLEARLERIEVKLDNLAYGFIKDSANR